MMIFGEKASPLWEAGISVIPCAGKMPVVKEWSKYCNEQVEISILGAWEQTYSDCNIGMPCGRASGIVVLDIDDASLFDKLPISPVSWRGREGRESRAFKWSGESVEHYAGIDIIGHGGQVILPPSIHPETGKPYIWLNNALPFDDLPTLPKGRDSSVFQPLNRGPSGERSISASIGRWNTLSALSFAMACDGESLDAICEKMLAHECKSWFYDTTENHRGTNPPKAARRMAEDAIKKALLQNKRIETTSPQVAIDVSKLIAARLTQDSPRQSTDSHVYRHPPLPPEGAMRWIYEYIEQQSSPQIPSLALGGAISIMSSLLQNRFKCGRIGLSTYVLNVAPSGTGKSFPYAAAEKLVPHSMLGAGGYKSGKVFTNSLAKQRERLDVLDEVSAMFAHMRDGSSFQSELVDIMCGAWSAGPTSFFRFSQSVSGIKDGERTGVWSPAVSILASTTNAGLLNSISKTMTEKGFFPRFLIFPQPMLDWKEALSDRDWLGPIVQWRNMIFERYPILLAGQNTTPANPSGSMTEAPDAQRIARDVQPFDRSHLNALSRKYFEARKLQDADEAFDAFQARKIEQVVKIALMYELGRMTDPTATHVTQSRDEHGRPFDEAYVDEAFTIQKDAFDYAEELWDWMFVSQRVFISSLAESSDRVRIMKQVLKYIEEANTKGVSQARLTKQFGRLTRRERDEIVSDLLVSEQIRVVERDSSHGKIRVYEPCR